MNKQYRLFDAFEKQIKQYRFIIASNSINRLIIAFRIKQFFLRIILMPKSI